PGMWSEMLNDRSFEGVTKLSSWCYYDGSPDFCDRPWDRNPSWSYDNANPFNGRYCVRLNAEHGHRASLTQSGLAVKKGMACNFSGYFRSDKSLPITVLLKTRLPDGSWLTLASAKLPSVSADWRKYSVSLRSAGETDRAVFEVEAEGQGKVWADKLSLMPSDNLQGWRPDAIAAIKDVHPGIIRFGGSVCDPGGYRWKNGIGDRDRREPFPNKVWGRIDSNDAGIDEFCQFCELTGAASLICLSFSDGPQNAADLIEYCNGDAQTPWGSRRAANGHPAAYRVKYWQIGNEISGDDQNYLAKLPLFASLMKKADPNISLLSSFPTQKLLACDGADLAFIAPHHYTPDLASCDQDFTRLSKMIDSTPGCAALKIAVTEWNISGGNFGLMRGKYLTLETALLNARYLHVLMRHSDKAEIACRSNMANSLGSGIIETSPSGLLKRPSYYVMQLYARHVQPIPLKVERGSQDAASPDLFACASADKKSATIFAINSTPAPVDFSWEFTGFDLPLHVIKAETVCDTQNARQSDIMNHWAAPDRVRTVALTATETKMTLPALSVTALECEAR
ncbi:MAG TPA: alpha-L-arabinofuranosidase C-terminal domain-containing protein, partial [Candidatus Saccharimonadales bacterium]|nr:alpha-L-arabinofuranosidase C-terminal domain-containing protein [Candidatus Saccharimonadales bacterium]